ncbi:MAG: hypothetical protein M1814_005021 [Vezdaea aestivalis]|nr:MAG: hypothetical protein M1814_005021 [Vezdaea aestivalis]
MSRLPLIDGENDSELESFRQQWREEVSAKHKGKGIATEIANSQAASSSKPTRRTSIPIRPEQHGEDSLGKSAGKESNGDGEHQRPRIGPTELSSVQAAPASALDHYEKAVERENEGSLGDSVNHYRKAFRMDDQVDRAYRAKHFPQTSKADLLSTAPETSSSKSKPDPIPIQPSFDDLITSFSSLTLLAAPPIIPSDPPPPSPLSRLPTELLLEILTYALLVDPAHHLTISLTAKHLAHLLHTTPRIWLGLLASSKFGFPTLHTSFRTALFGTPLNHFQLPSTPLNLLLAPLQIFRTLPRPRFCGLYISTNNYTRSGSSSGANSVTWNTPMHIVTYYRYLRLYRDGTALTLLSTIEPKEVVPVFSMESVEEGAVGEAGRAVTKYALRGRWRMSRGGLLNMDSQKMMHEGDSLAKGAIDELHDDEEVEEDEEEGVLHVETQGADSKYIYKLELKMQNTRGRGGKGACNTKLEWRHFFIFNTLTGSRGKLDLPNDRAFVWSRVKRYGL